MKEEGSGMPVYSMGVAERLTGLTARQIRYWEQHGLIQPSRTGGGQRMYSEGDVVRLKEIKRLLGEGMTLDRVKAYFATREKRLRTADDNASSRVSERIPRVASLYTGANRAELIRMMERKTK